MDTALPQRRDRRQVCATILRVLADEYAIDPLLLMCLVVGAEPLLEHTLIGHRLLRAVLEVVGDNPCDPYYLEPWEILEGYREELQGGARRGALRGCAVNQEKAVKLQVRGAQRSRDGAARSRLGRQGKSIAGTKSCILADMLLSHHEARADHVYACLVQVVFRSGSRVNEVYRDASECLVACRNRLRPPERDLVEDEDNSVLSIVEVPNKLQRTYKLYVDWEVLTGWFGSDFFKLQAGGAEACTELEKLEALRALAQGCPGCVVRMLSELGLLPTPGPELVQVAVTEGTRWIEREGCHKVSFHFVLQVFVTRPQYEEAWQAVLAQLGEACPSLLDFFRLLSEADGLEEKRGAVRDVLPKVPPAFLPLVGMDQHCLSNLEQGLAFPLSRKKVEDERSRFVRIAHVRRRDGCEMLSEIPCKRTWCAHVPIGRPGPKPRDMDPAALLDALLVVSICLPSPRCIGLAPRCAVEEIAFEAHGVDENSRCSTASTVRGADADNEPFGGQSSGLQRLSLGARACAMPPPRACHQAQQRQQFGEGTGPVWRLTAAQRRALTGRDGRGAAYDAGWMRMAELCVKGRSGRAAASGEQPGEPRGGAKRKRRASEEEEEEGSRGEAVRRMPGWFLDILQDKCPGFSESLTTGMRYGSRPSCAAPVSGGGLLFQLNKCGACVCVNRLMQVPFRGHATHSSNGTLFYVDGEDVYATCLKEGCKTAMLARREADWFLADRLQRLLLHGDSCKGGPLHGSAHFRTVVGAGGLALLQGVQDAVEAVREGRVTGEGHRTAQFLVGSRSHYPAEGEVGEGCLCVSSMAKVPSSMMCNSLNGKRTWVQLTSDMLLDYFAKFGQDHGE